MRQLRATTSLSSRLAPLRFIGCCGKQASPSNRQLSRLCVERRKDSYTSNDSMSLLDALLLEPYQINVWIAYRTDGVAGSGTQNDPYDGSTATRFDAPVLDLLRIASTRLSSRLGRRGRRRQ